MIRGYVDERVRGIVREELAAERINAPVSPLLSHRAMLDSINTSAILPLLGVVVGWLLNEVATFIRARREEKKVIGRAVLRLLELRDLVAHSIRNIHIRRRILSSGELSPDDKQFLKELRTEGLHEFADNVGGLFEDIAMIEPVLAFRVQVKLQNVLGILVNSEGLYDSASESRILTEMYTGMNEIATKDLYESLGKTALQLLRRKSLYQWLQNRAHINEIVDFEKYAELVDKARPGLAGVIKIAKEREGYKGDTD